MNQRITVGLRIGGFEYWAHRWVKTVPGFLLYIPFLEGNPTFIHQLVVEGTAFDAHGRELNGPRGSDYGHCVYDFDRGLVFSRNDYFDPRAFVCPPQESMRVLALHKRGIIERFEDPLKGSSLSVKEGVALVEKGHLLTIHLKHEFLHTDHITTRSGVEDVQNYLKATQWQSV